MRGSVWKSLGSGAVFAAVLVGLGVAGAVPAAAEGPFANMSGRWVGGGKIVYAGGKTESLTCRVTYKIDGGGSAARQNIRCAGASTTFAVSSNFQASGNKVTGSWSESTYNVNGSISGKVSGGTVSVGISGGSFTGSMSVNTNGSSQSVVIKPTSDTVDKIALNLRKG